MFNLSICALSASFISTSLIISPSSFSTIFSKNFYKQIRVQQSFTSFFIDHSNIASILFVQSNFINFLSTPIALEKEDLKYANKKYTDQFLINLESKELAIIGCTFINYSTDKNKRGGAIKCIYGSNGLITVYSSTFEKCKAKNGDGGAIFVCGTEQDTNYESTHIPARAFNSKYCCYSKCSATGQGQTEGFANSIVQLLNVQQKINHMKLKLI